MLVRRGSKSLKVLKALVIAGGALTLAAIAPAQGAKTVNTIIRLYIRKRRFEREKFLRDLKHLQIRKLISFEELPNREIKMVLTKHGKAGMLKFNLDEMKLNTTKAWDGRWRLVMFDIPHNKRKARDALRAKLLHIGFYPLQKSVFITPHECEQEIDFIGTVFDVRNYILILYVSSFEGVEKLRHHFSI